MHKDTKKLSLYNLTSEIDALAQLIEMDEGEITEDHQALMDYADALITEKTDQIVNFFNHLKDEVSAAKARRDELTEFIRARENAIKRLSGYVLGCMDKLQTNNFRGDLYEIKERKPSKALRIEDENAVPNEYVTVETTVKVDKMKLKNAVKNGLEVKGISLVDGARSISFKTKSLSKGRRK